MTQQPEQHPVIDRKQAAIAIAAMLVGAALYILERPLGLSEDGALVESGGALVGFLGRVIPDVLHPFAFAMLTGALLKPSSMKYGLVCLTWALIDLVLEVGAAPPVLAWLETVSKPYIGSVPGIEAMLGYFREGVFSMVNVLAVLFGACLAWFVLLITAKRDDLHFIIRNSPGGRALRDERKPVSKKGAAP